MQQNNKQTWNTVSVFFLFLTHSETKKTVKTWSVNFKNFDGIASDLHLSRNIQKKLQYYRCCFVRLLATT